jgi:hypothetical protein
MPRYFHNLSSVYSFMKLALRNDTVAIHLPPIRNPMYKLDEVKPINNAVLPENFLGLVLTEVNTGKRLMEFHLRENTESNTLMMHNFYIRDKVFTPYEGSKILPTILFKFLDQFAFAAGHEKISVVFSEEGFRVYNLKENGYKISWGGQCFVGAIKKIPRN